jgi:hypothetical protein
MVWTSWMLLAVILVFSVSVTAADQLRNSVVVPDPPNPLLDSI